MATTVNPLALGAYFADSDDVLIRQMGRVLQAWDYEPAEIDAEGTQEETATVSGHLVFGGPPNPDVGDDITTWYVNTDVEVIEMSELVEMQLAKTADEAARPVYGLGDKGELVVADGSTVLAAEVNRLIDAGIDRYAERQAVLDAPMDMAERVAFVAADSDRQLASRRRTLARFARDYAKAWEDGEDPDMLGMLESNLQVTVRRVMELTEP